MKVQSAQRIRWQRRVRRAVCWCVGLVLIALVGVLVLLHSLNRAWLKQRLIVLALERSGLEIGYGSAELRSWGRLRNS